MGGGILTDGITRLQFKGSILEFDTVVKGLIKLQKQIGPRSLMIDTVPMPDRGALVVDIRFRGPMSEFEKVIEGLDDLRSTIAIDTVPLPTRAPEIGTWPTPETPENAFGWTIFTHLAGKLVR